MDVSLGTVPRTSVSFDKSALRRGQYLCFEETLKEDVVFSVKTNIITIKEFKNNKNVHGLLSINALDCDKISGKIRAVKKNNSDTVKLAGSSVTKTVKKLLTEKKIPIEYRANLPVYADDIGIVWIYGVGVADRVKIDKTTNNVMYIDLKIFKENTYGTE